MNILHVFRAPVGGLFRHVTDLVRGQIGRGHRVGIVADSLTGDGRSKDVFAELAPRLALGLSLTPMPRQLSPRDLAATLHVSRRLRASGADIVHGHGGKGGAYARLAPAGKRLVRAYTPHGGSLLLDHGSLSGRAYLVMERILKPRGNLYLFESAFSADVFRAKIGQPPGVIRIIPNGVTKAEFEPVAPAADASDLVFVGELRAVKGIDTLLNAIAMLHRGGFKARATLIGDGPDAASLQALAARLGLVDAVRFVPSMPMREALTYGKLLVFPSRAESMPYVVLEAAAAARPMIATNVGGIPEIFGALAHALVPPGDAPALAAAIRQSFADPAGSAQRAQVLQQRVAAGFSVEAMVEGVLAAYEQALERALTPRRALFARA